MLAVGTQLGRYTILAPLGAGGMGEVYRARDSRLDRDVAVKVLPDAFAFDPNHLGRFEREAKAVAALSHPNILAIHDCGNEQGVCFAVMELLEGQTLRQRLAEGSLPWRKAAEIGAAIADGLAASHARGIIHRDLKPGNLFLTTDGQVKILDFGLARIDPPSATTAPTVSYQEPITQTGAVLGTVGYMSPEQVRGQVADARSDIFSLGCVLYQMVSGQIPFAGATAAETQSAILRDDPPNLGDTQKPVPSELERMIRRCLEKNPEERFQAARDLAFALRTVRADSQPSEPVRSQSPSALAPPARPNRWKWLLAGCLLVAVLFGAGAYLASALNKGQEREKDPADASMDTLAVLPFGNVSKVPELDSLGDSIPWNLVKSLSEVRSLTVRPFSSVARFKGQPSIDHQQAGQQLKVRAVLTGTVDSSTNGLTVTVELVDARDNKVLWIQRYDRQRSDMQAIQADIARKVCDRLRVSVTDEEQRRLSRRYTENPRAYDLMVKGRYSILKWTRHDVELGIRYLDQSLKLDPNNALAHAGRAEAHVIAAYLYLEPKKAMEEARQSAKEALRLDEQLAEAYTWHAVVKYHCDWNWSGAKEDFERSLALDPGYAMGHDWYAWYLAAVGKMPEALTAMKKARDLEPDHVVINADLSYFWICMRQYDEAIKQCQHTLRLDPNDVQAHGNMALAYTYQREYSAAIKQFEEVSKRNGVAFYSASLGYVYARMGNKAAARKELEALKQPGQLYSYRKDCQAAIHLALEEKAEAVALLDQACDDRSPGLTFLLVDPVWDELRSDPRFARILGRIGLGEKARR